MNGDFEKITSIALLIFWAPNFGGSFLEWPDFCFDLEIPKIIIPLCSNLKSIFSELDNLFGFNIKIEISDKTKVVNLKVIPSVLISQETQEIDQEYLFDIQLFDLRQESYGREL